MATLAMANMVYGVLQGRRQLAGSGPVVLQELKRHALRRLDAHPGQALEGLHQRDKGVRISHDDGCFL
jgi:hypothetical protein